MKSKSMFFKILIIIGLAQLFISLNSVPARSIPSISEFNIRRTNGYSDGKGTIQGHFSISIIGSTSVIEIKLFFNETEVAQANSNILTFNFNTDDYPHGVYNITAFVCDSSDNCNQQSLERNFVDASVNNPYWILLGVTGVGIIVLIVVVNLISKKNQKPPTKDGVNIDDI